MSKTFRWWAINRRIQYGTGFASFWVIVGLIVYFANFYQPANCFDGVMNGDELEVDCSGSCVAICPSQVTPPQIEWVRAFEITPGQYNVVAYVENPNQAASPLELGYTLKLMNGETVVAERAGVSSLPPNTVTPIFEGRLRTDGGVSVTEARMSLDYTSQHWRPASYARTQFRDLNRELMNADSKPRLEVEIENTGISTAEDVEVVATVFNEKGEAVTASQTYIDAISARSTEDIIFTWPNSIAHTVKSCTIPTDVAVAIDLSGSMNNDGGDPLQPVTAALAAAAEFANTMKEDDQIAVITFATEAKVAGELSPSPANVAAAIQALTIDPAEEQGFTNTPAALQAAQTELNSARHNDNARRVAVLLTDGLPTAPGEEDVVGQAEMVAKTLISNNIELYVIGLGQAVNQEFLQSLVSEPDKAFLAPTTDELSDIYTQITSSLCTVGPTRIDVVAKGPIDFAPLR
jgi:Mg-chelatase subunit ChlD